MENLKHLLFALVIFSGILIGMSSFTAELFYNYGETSESVAALGIQPEVEAHVTVLRDTIKDTKITGVNIIDIPLAIASGVYKTFKLMFYSVDLYSAILGNAAQLIPIPGWFINTVIGCISIFIIYQVISAITKWDV